MARNNVPLCLTMFYLQRNVLKSDDHVQPAKCNFGDFLESPFYFSGIRTQIRQYLSVYGSVLKGQVYQYPN